MPTIAHPRRLSARPYVGPAAAAPDSSLFERYCGKLFSPVNGAERYLLSVPAHLELKEPLTVEFPSSHAHLVVVVGEGAKADIAEIIAGSSRRSFSHGVELFVGAGASVSFLSFQNAPPAAAGELRHRCAVGGGASLRMRMVTLGGRDIIHGVESEARGADAESAIDWTFYARGEERYELALRNIFRGACGRGDAIQRGVAEERAHASARGMIQVGPAAQGTKTFLTQKVLMLDPTAKVDAIPGLEIQTNDVKASHSASIARLSSEELFYFAARGIGDRDARRMYLTGFLGEFAGELPHSPLKDRIHRALVSKFSRPRSAARS